MQVNGYRIFESKKNISGNTKLILVTPDDILRSYALNIIYSIITCNPEPLFHLRNHAMM